MPHAEGESREITLSLAPRGSTRADPQVGFLGLRKRAIDGNPKNALLSLAGNGQRERVEKSQQLGCAISLAW